MKKRILKGILILPVVNIVDAGNSVDTSNDSIIITQHFENVAGGTSLDVSLVDATAYPVISAGWPVIRETATGVLKALGVTSGAFSALPSGHTYYGVVRASILRSRPFASVMVRGTVNIKAFENSTKNQYNLATGLIIPAALNTAVPLVRLTSDKH